jgi:hypothetical protein
MIFIGITLLIGALISFLLTFATITRRQTLARWCMFGNAITAGLLIAGLINLVTS